jgi:molecular chaperone GrpE (heat shock protein)
LSSIQGGNIEETRFEERIRILRILADIASEYEAFTINQPGDHRELEALIKGIFNILARNKVKPMDEIGTQVVFSSAKHRIVDSTNITNGAIVSIIERGFLIKDHKGQIRLLKPALVSK